MLPNRSDVSGSPAPAAPARHHRRRAANVRLRDDRKGRAGNGVLIDMTYFLKQEGQTMPSVRHRARSIAIAAAAVSISSVVTFGAGGLASAKASATRGPQASAAAWGTPASAHGGSVKIVRTSAGALLVGPNGHTLYMFSHDTKNHDTCAAISGCASNWPPFTASSRPKAGAGVRASMLGLITLSGGKKQVTYAGHPLYYYSGDTAAAQTGYLGTQVSGGTWYGISASGGRVR